MWLFCCLLGRLQNRRAEWVLFYSAVCLDGWIPGVLLCGLHGATLSSFSAAAFSFLSQTAIQRQTVTLACTHTHTHTTVCLYIHPFNSCCIAEQLGRTCPATFTCVLYISVSVYMCSVCLCVKCALSQHTWVINFQHGWVFTMAGCVCECVCAVGKVAAVNTNLVPEKTNVFNPWLSCPVLLSLPLSLSVSLSLSLSLSCLPPHSPLAHPTPHLAGWWPLALQREF